MRVGEYLATSVDAAHDVPPLMYPIIVSAVKAERVGIVPTHIQARFAREDHAPVRKFLLTPRCRAPSATSSI